MLAHDSFSTLSTLSTLSLILLILTLTLLCIKSRGNLLIKETLPKATTT